MERIIRCQIGSALSNHCRLSKCQHGFCPNHSTISLLLSVIHNWALCLESQSTIHCIFLDYAKAFDSVPHERLLIKLNAIGITGSLLNWLRGFLTNQHQRVVVNSCYSDWLLVLSRVPQGSVLGPLLFLLYINDLHEVISHSELNVFADDVALYKEIKSSSDYNLLQEDLNNVFFWSEHWQLRLGPPKCEALCISNKRSPITTTYSVNDIPLQWSTSVRYLRLHSTTNLCWSKHCKIIAARTTKCLNYLRHTLWSAPPQVKSTAYRCVVCPLLEYGWNPFTQKNIQLLENIQRCAACRVCGSRWDPSMFSWTKSSDQCLEQLRWPSLKSRHDYLSVNLLYDIINNKIAVKFSDFCSFVSSCTRRHSLSILPLQSTINALRYSFFGNTPFIWNNIPFDTLIFLALIGVMIIFLAIRMSRNSMIQYKNVFYFSMLMSQHVSDQVHPPMY